MQFPSFGLIFSREASFFSKKTAQIMKSLINPPKKVANSYSLFFMEKYPEFKGSDMKMTEIAKSIGNKWNNLSQEQKALYFEKANDLKLINDSAKARFKQALTEKHQLALNLLNLNRQARNGAITRKSLNAEQKAFLNSLPESSAITPRGVFLSQKLKGVSGTDTKPSDSLAEAMKEWSNMSTSEQEPFVKQAESNLKSYTESISKFLKN